MIKSAYRTCQILKYISEHSNGLRHAEIRKALNIPTSSLTGILSTLVNQKFVLFDSERQKYFLGSEMFLISSTFLNSMDIVIHGKPIVHELAIETRESIAISVKIGEDIFIVYNEDSTNPIIPTFSVGKTYPIYASASGKCILAYLPENEIDKYLSSVNMSPHTKNTITDIKTLTAELKKIRSSGIAFSKGEYNEKIFVVAAPVLNSNKSIVGALSISLPFMRRERAKEEEYIKSLKIGANKLSKRLGYS